MFRSSGLVFCVVVMAAFVFGCGGGGSGTPPPDPEPPVVTPVPPTDAEQIADAQRAIATILSNARAQAARASSAASALQTNVDAMDDEKTRADSHNTDAQSALARIVSAQSAASTAATPAAAQIALTNAQTAQNTLNTAVSSIEAIKRTVQAVTDARMGQERAQLALTNNSSLIQHLRDNKLLADTVLGTEGAILTAASLVVAAAGDEGALTNGVRAACTAPCAEHPLYTGTGAGADRVTGQRTVRVTPTGGTALTSSSTTPTLSGIGRLPHGFDLKNATDTTFVNAYTDIAPERRGAGNATADDTVTTPYDERYDYILDTDYLLAGIWLTVGGTNLSDSRITAFAYGSQPLDTTIVSLCGTQGGSTASVISGSARICNMADSASNIGDFVEDGRDVNATYSGQANGTHLAGGDSSYFTGDVTLTATFVNPTDGAASDNNGSIEGAVTNIVAGGQSMPGSIELQKHTFSGDAIGGLFGATGADPSRNAVGVVDGKSFSGHWKGQFFGQEFRRFSTTEVNPNYDATITDRAEVNYYRNISRVDYKAQAPGSVAGTFYATQQSNPKGDEAFIGAFGAHR